MRVVYRYLLGTLSACRHVTSPVSSLLVLTTGVFNGAQSDVTSNDYLFGPEDLSDSDSPISAPRLHVTLAGQPTPLPMIAYQCAGTTCCFFLQPASLLDLDFYRRLQDYIQPKLTALDVRVAQKAAVRASLTAKVSQDYPYDYVYFNHMNLAQKSTFLPLSQRKPADGDEFAARRLAALCRSEEVQLMGDIRADFDVQLGSQREAEILAKTHRDSWVVGRRSEQREYFLQLTNKPNANLIEINGRWCAGHCHVGSRGLV
jgi:hypothetical protein